MTIRGILSVMLRRWYVPLAVLSCVALATVILAQDGGIYTTRTVISFLRPAGTSLAPDNGANDASVIAFAATVVSETNNGRRPEGYSMSDAPYYGSGIREGVLVEMTNSGNQWASNVDKAEIEIDIAGRTFHWVETQQEELVDNVLAIADSLQEVVAVSAENRISASVVPLTTQIDYIAPSRRTQLTAGGAMLAVAILVSAWGSITVDGALAKRRSEAGRAEKTTPTRTDEGVTS